MTCGNGSGTALGMGWVAERWFRGGEHWAVGSRDRYRALGPEVGAGELAKGGVMRSGRGRGPQDAERPRTVPWGPRR